MRRNPHAKEVIDAWLGIRRLLAATPDPAIDALIEPSESALRSLTQEVQAAAREGWRASIVFGATPSHRDRAKYRLEMVAGSAGSAGPEKVDKSEVLRTGEVVNRIAPRISRHHPGLLRLIRLADRLTERREHASRDLADQPEKEPAEGEREETDCDGNRAEPVRSRIEHSEFGIVRTNGHGTCAPRRVGVDILLRGSAAPGRDAEGEL